MNNTVKQYGLETVLRALLIGKRRVRLDEVVTATDLSVNALIQPMQRLVTAGVAAPIPSGWEVNVFNGEPRVYHQEVLRLAN